MTEHKPKVKAVSCLCCIWVDYVRVEFINSGYYCRKTRQKVSNTTICDKFKGVKSPESMNFRTQNCCLNCKHSKIDVDEYNVTSVCDIDNTNITGMDNYYCANWEGEERNDRT